MARVPCRDPWCSCFSQVAPAAPPPCRGFSPPVRIASPSRPCPGRSSSPNLSGVTTANSESRGCRGVQSGARERVVGRCEVPRRCYEGARRTAGIALCLRPWRQLLTGLLKVYSLATPSPQPVSFSPLPLLLCIDQSQSKSKNHSYSYLQEIFVHLTLLLRRRPLNV